MKQIFYVSAMALVLLTGCGGTPNNNDEYTAAAGFWAAYLKGDSDKAKKYMLNGDTAQLFIRTPSPLDKVSFGKSIRDQGYSFIETTLTLHRDGSVALIPLQTVVIPANGSWKVEYGSTIPTVFETTLDRNMQLMASTINNAGKYLYQGALSEADKKIQLAYVQERLTEQFAQAKKYIVDQYKLNLDGQGNISSVVASNP